MNLASTALKRFFLATAIAATLSFVAHAQSMPGHEPPAGMMPPHSPHDMAAHFGDGPQPHYLRGMKLSEVQQDKIFAIVHLHAQVMRDQAKAVKKANDDLREIAFAEQYDDARAKAAADTSGKAMADMALLRARIDRQIVAVLTPEQRQALNDRNFR